MQTSKKEQDLIIQALTRLSSQYEIALEEAPAKEILALRDRLKKEWKEMPEKLAAAVAPQLSPEVAGRLQEYGEQKPHLFVEVEDVFFGQAEDNGFDSWERDWYDPETRKVYHSYLKLEVEEVDHDYQQCPLCGDDVDWEDAPVGRCAACQWEIRREAK